MQHICHKLEHDTRVSQGNIKCPIIMLDFRCLYRLVPWEARRRRWLTLQTRGEGNTTFQSKNHELHVPTESALCDTNIIAHSVPSPAISRPIKSLHVDKIIVFYRHDQCLRVQKQKINAHMLIFVYSGFAMCF